MGAKRTYGDACGIARALDIVGERWALMVVRELTLGPKRFTDLRHGLPHVSPDVLAQRLRDLEEGGVVRHCKLPPPYSAHVYELTDCGRGLEPVLIALGRWGGAHGRSPCASMHMSLDASILSLRTLFDPERAGDAALTIGLRFHDVHRFRIAIDDGRIETERGEAPDADATIASEPIVLLDVLHGRRSFDEALAAGELRIEGDAGAARRFASLFPLPVPAPAPAAV